MTSSDLTLVAAPIHGRAATFVPLLRITLRKWQVARTAAFHVEPQGGRTVIEPALARFQERFAKLVD